MPSDEAARPSRTSVLARLKRGLFMTHTELIAKVGGRDQARFEPDPRALEALEEGLLSADVGPATAAELVAAVKGGGGPAATPPRPTSWAAS